MPANVLAVLAILGAGCEAQPEEELEFPGVAEGVAPAPGEVPPTPPEAISYAVSL